MSRLKNVPFYYLSKLCPKWLCLKSVHLKSVRLKCVRLKNVAVPLCRLKDATDFIRDQCCHLQGDVVPLFSQEMSKIRGPFAFIYFRPKSGRLWFGRDFFGRHSLLMETGPDRFVLSSVGHRSLTGWVAAILENWTWVVSLQWVSRVDFL